MPKVPRPRPRAAIGKGIDTGSHCPQLPFLPLDRVLELPDAGFGGVGLVDVPVADLGTTTRSGTGGSSSCSQGFVLSRTACAAP